MSKLIAPVKNFLREEDAPTMVEYGLLVALIALVVAAAAYTLGGAISGLFTEAGTAVTSKSYGS
ncbi:MAG: Flp family type IVb pilin [Pirellulales bacterium]